MSFYSFLFGGDYQAVNAVDFEASQYAERGTDLTGLTDSSKGIFFCFINTTVTTAGSLVLGNASNNFAVYFANGSLAIACTNGSNSLQFGGAAGLGSGTWRSVLGSWDTNFASGARLSHLYIDDVSSKTITADNGAAFNVDYTDTNWSCGARVGGTNPLTACMANIYFAPGQYLDLSITANRRKFITAANKPVGLGDYGGTPTGTAPAVFFGNSAERFFVNKGTGGNFVPTGQLGICSSTPA